MPAMPRYLIDANLPHLFTLWSGPDFLHVQDLGADWSDRRVWNYALKHRLTIVTKDADFSDRVMFHGAPPKVIHIRLGNLKMRELHAVLTRAWPEIVALAAEHKLVRVFLDRIEFIG